MRQLLVERQDELAAIVTREHGKVLADAKGEISRGIENVEFAAGLVHLLKGEFSQQVSRGVDVHSVKQPVGVVACITPFNFPVMVPLWMTASAIACGNTVVLKPSEKDPGASDFLVKLFEDAGLPEGRAQRAPRRQGRGRRDPRVARRRAPSASWARPPWPARSTSAAPPRASASRRSAAPRTTWSSCQTPTSTERPTPRSSAAYGAAGERCMAISVLVAVGDATADALVAKVAERMGKLVIGDGTDPASEMGPLITREHRDRVASYVTGAEAEGATVVVDGTAKEFEGDGFFIGVSLVDNVKPGMRVYEDEIFGPVLSVVRVETYDEAVALINANSFANGTAIFTRDGGTARRFEVDAEVGMVGVNVPLPVPVGAYSFGGWRNSLFGDSHIYGPESVHFYTRSKVVTTRWPEPSESQIDLGFPSNH